MSKLFEALERLEELVDGSLTEAKRADWHKTAMRFLRAVARDLKSLGIKADIPKVRGNMVRMDLHYTENYSPPTRSPVGNLGGGVVSVLREKYGIKFASKKRIWKDGVTTTWLDGIYNGFLVKCSEWIGIDQYHTPSLKGGHMVSIFVSRSS